MYYRIYEYVINHIVHCGVVLNEFEIYFSLKS